MSPVTRPMFGINSKDAAIHCGASSCPAHKDYAKETPWAVVYHTGCPLEEIGEITEPVTGEMGWGKKDSGCWCRPPC